MPVPSPPRETWRIDTVNSELRFTVNHLVISKISGRFTRWASTVLLDPADVRRSSVEVTVQAASIDTGNAERDAHLRSPEFLDVDHHPEFWFRSREITPAGDDDYLINGELTLRGQVHPLTLFVSDEGRVRDPGGQPRAAFLAHGGFNRRDFGMIDSSTTVIGRLIVGDMVEVNVEAEASPSEPK